MFRFLKDLIFGRQDTIKANVMKKELTRSIVHNCAVFKDIFQRDDSIIFRDFETADGMQCLIIFTEGMVDKELVTEKVILQVMTSSIIRDVPRYARLETLAKKVISVNDLTRTADIEQIVTAILYGDTFFLVEGEAEGLLIDTKGWAYRAIESPESENVVRGPREGFTESLEVNMTLIRRKIKNPELKFTFRELGKRTKTSIAICYIENLAHQKIIQELMNRLEKIELDGVLESGYIEEFIKDSPFMPFKTVGFTERPDVVAAKLLEGRVAIICDGTPFVLTVPFLFSENFQVNEDYYKNYFLSSISRLMRYLAFFVSTSTPALYLAVITFHQEMIPTPLILSISAARMGVPFPSVFETIILGLVFEFLREGGVRLPTPIGQAISIVGAIILGDAAVQAKIVSAPIIIVTAFTGISGFLVPQMFGVIVIVRVIFVLLASFFGLYGYMFGVIGFFIQTMSMRSFGIPYMLNWGSVTPQDIKDTVIRAPWWYMKMRPKLLGKVDSERKATTQWPGKRER